MSQTKHTVRGNCLCGKIRYAISGHLGIFQYCHCSRCRRFTGSAFAANLFVSPEQFQWLDGEPHVGTFAPPDSKYFTTAFCTHCGSSLPSLTKNGKAVIVPAGTLNAHLDIKPSQNIFCASSATWYQPPEQLPQHDELPPRKR